MKHELTDAGNGRKALRITVDWSEVATDYEDVFAKYSKATVPGFRPGKASRALIEQRFRKQLRNDFTARCGRRLARQALSELHLRAAGSISVIEINFAPGQEFSFTAECVPLPQLQLPDYADVPVAGLTEDERRDSVTEWLLENTAWDPPDALIREELNRGEPAGGELESPECQAAAKRVKLMLILEQIAEAEGIEADERDVNDRIAKMAADNEVKPDELRRQLREDGVLRLQVLLCAEQTLAYLLDKSEPRATM